MNNYERQSPYNIPSNSNYIDKNAFNYNCVSNLYRSNSHPKNKFSFKTMKGNTISSLNDVEHFLNNLQHAFKYIKLYKLLK